MAALTLLSTTLGLSALAGINLYLTVFVTSLSLQRGWLVLSPDLQPLEVLNNPLIVFLSGLFYFIEFVADKIPWIDSLWDVVHTAIRPVGAAILSISVLGTQDPLAQVVAVLLCGSIALGTHATKAGLRLLANTSPEPFSNIALSVGEDAVVLGGVYGVLHYPFLGLALLLILAAVFLWLAPFGWRQIRAMGSYILSKLNTPGEVRPLEVLPRYLPENARQRLGKALGETERLEWAVAGFSGRMPGWRRNERVYLALTTNPRRLALVAVRREGPVVTAAPETLEISVLQGFLYDELQAFCPRERVTLLTRFPKGAAAAGMAVRRELEPFPFKAPAGSP